MSDQAIDREQRAVEDRLVRENQKLVAKLARECHAPHQDLPDLIQEGNLGLVLAIRKFDPARGVKLATYAAWWIRAYQLRWLVANHRLVKLGTTAAQRKLFFNLRGVEAKLGAIGATATPAELARRLGVREIDAVEMRERLSQREVSLDAPVGEGDTSWGARLPGDTPAPESEVEACEVVGILREETERLRFELDGRDRSLFDSRWNHDDDEQPTLRAMSRQLGLSHERVRQLERRMLGKLKQQLERRIEPRRLAAVG